MYMLIISPDVSSGLQAGANVMDSDDENNEIAARSKHYNALRVELVAALSAFDRAQDWAVRLALPDNARK